MGLANTKDATKNLIKQDFYMAFKAAQVSGANKTPQQADQDLQTLCDKLATGIMNNINAWLQDSKKIVASKTEAAHPGSYQVGEIHNSKSNDQCGVTF